jgi:hypothetical protein
MSNRKERSLILLVGQVQVHLLSRRRAEIMTLMNAKLSEMVGHTAE